jgi:hypothetical protein
MADAINVEIVEDEINVELTCPSTPEAIFGVPSAENDFIVGSDTLTWVVKTLAQIKTILGLSSYSMKYLDTINLAAMATTTVTTTVTTEPYNVFLLDSSGIDITPNVTITLELSGGVYKIHIYSVDALNNVKLKIIY